MAQILIREPTFKGVFGFRGICRLYYFSTVIHGLGNNCAATRTVKGDHILVDGPVSIKDMVTSCFYCIFGGNLIPVYCRREPTLKGVARPGRSRKPFIGGIKGHLLCLRVNSPPLGIKGYGVLVGDPPGIQCLVARGALRYAFHFGAACFRIIPAVKGVTRLGGSI